MMPKNLYRLPKKPDNTDPEALLAWHTKVRVIKALRDVKAVKLELDRLDKRKAELRTEYWHLYELLYAADPGSIDKRTHNALAKRLNMPTVNED